MSTATGTVTASWGHRSRVETEDGALEAVTKGRKLRPVCGDRVRVEPAQDSGPARIVAIEERSNTLTRPDSRGRTQVLAANIDRLVVVVATRPEPDPYMLDRYLASAELMGVGALIAFNKAELREADALIASLLPEYRALGYPCLQVSVKAEQLDPLRDALHEGISILVGQSGVGKSSILNRLVPDAEREVGDISSSSEEGRHTTTASMLFHLPGGGALIDSPGVRDYAPGTLEAADVARGFREIWEVSGACRFNDCRHRQEPACAVRQAVETGAISERRLKSYHRMLNLMSGLRDSLGPGWPQSTS